MKKIYISMLCLQGILLLGCGGSTANKEASEEPGPITEGDRSRYNLNAPDELNYGTIDTAQDTIPADSVVK